MLSHGEGAKKANSNKSRASINKRSTIINSAERFEYVVDNLQHTEGANPNVAANIIPQISNVEDAHPQDVIMSNAYRQSENAGKSSSTQKFSFMNVREWVQRYDRQQLRMSSLVKILDSGIVEPADRRELVRIAVAGMVEFNDGNLYPSCQLKTQLAKDIITAFPKLCSASGGYEHFYEPKTNRGFIEFRLKNLRLKLDPSEKRLRASSGQVRERRGSTKLPVLSKVVVNDKLLNEEEFNSKITQLTSLAPTEENKLEVFKLIDETRPNRQIQIKTAFERIPLNTIFKMFPRFKDFEGELIRREFLAEYPNNDIFLERFTSYYAPRILQYCASTKPHLVQAIQDISDNNLKALVLLPELLPSPNYAKKKEGRKSSSTYKMRPVKPLPNDSLLQFVIAFDESLLHQLSEPKDAPLLLCCMKNNERRGNYYIKTEGHVFNVGSNAIVAFDVLLKMHFCFDVPFTADLVYFYDFITGCILQLNEPKGCCVALNSSLSNVNVTNVNPLNMFLR